MTPRLRISSQLIQSSLSNQSPLLADSNSA
jgi:hypothetical protein